MTVLAARGSVRRIVSRFRCTVPLLATVIVGTVRGAEVAEPLLPELVPPFSESSARATAEAEADVLWIRTMAADAVEAGFFAVAEGLYRKGLSLPAVDPASRRELSLGLATALIAQEKPDAAGAVLDSLEVSGDGAWAIRSAAVAFLRSDFAAVEDRLSGIAVDALPAADQGWFHFLRAMLFERTDDRKRADESFERALSAVTSNAQAAVFRLAQVQGQLRAGEASEGLVAQLKRLMEEKQGQRIGYQYALQYAVVLQTLERSQEAIEVLARQRQILPPGEEELRDQTLLMLGLIGLAGGDPVQGRQAFRDLLMYGSDRELQQAALIRLASTAPTQGGPATTSLRTLYDSLLAREPTHQLYENLLFFSAELALRNSDFVRAETDVESLLTRYPGTALRANALAVLASSSWQGQRYRNAANYVGQLRALSDVEFKKVGLAVLQGECYYRAGLQAGVVADFRNAAEVYSAAQAFLEATDGGEPTVGISRGTIFFQQVMATIRSGDLNGAAGLLDNRALTENVDPESRWQAEWNFVRALQTSGRVDDAFRRAEMLADVEAVPPELRLRFLWLSAQLSLDTGRPGDTGAKVERVLTFLESEAAQGVTASTRSQVASNAALLAAQARLETLDVEAGMRAMEELRARYPGSRAALYSFIVQARYLAIENQLVDAQRLLTKLADDYRDSEYASLALYEAALQAERRGQDAYLIEATQLLERMAKEYPDERYQFPAHLKQADISRRLLRFGAAEQIYEFLENTFPNHPDQSFVQLSLADTLLAQSANASEKFEGAITRLERLAVLPGAGTDLRVEAGHKLAHAWQVHGSAERASLLYWEVYERFLGKVETQPELGARGRYWLSRTLFELGQLEENAGRRESARKAYEAVLAHGLPGEKLARGRLGRFQSGI